MLRRQSAVRGMLLAVVVVLLTFTVALFGGFLHATTVADEATLENERSLLRNQIDVSLRATGTAQKVQLTWDDAFRAAGTPGRPIDVAWTDTYLGQFLSTNLHAQHIFLVGPDGKLLRAWENGKVAPGTGYATVEQETQNELREMAQNRSLIGSPTSYRTLKDAQWPLGEDGQPLSRWAGELGEFAGKPALITTVSIVPDNTFSLLKQTPNNVITVRMLDQSVLEGMSNDLLLADMQLTEAMPPSASRNSLELRTEAGQSLGWLSWRPNEVGSIVLRRTMPLLIAYLCLFVFVLGGGVVIVRQAIRLTREYAAREARAQRTAMHDPMLGLPNRTMVMQRLSRLLALQRDQESADGVLLAYIDLDHFKSINDAIGHHVGDEVLFEVVRRLRAAVPPQAMLGRLASDEFVVVYQGTAGRREADAIGEAIMAAFHDPMDCLGHRLAVSASCGIAWAPEQTKDTAELLRLADIALFRAKQRGRGRYRYFTEDMNATIRWRQDMEVELRRAIVSDSLEMLYQPIVHVADRRIVCFESLLRWPHRDRGDISPATFVPLAEQCGLMPQLGEWVLRRVFADSHKFNGSEISVNLSPLQLMSREFLPQLKALVEETGIKPSQFAFEITEGVLLDNSDRVLALLEEVQALGFRIALDDFGTGYSSLAYLRRFQFDRIKIDRSFVQGIESDLDAQAILKTIVSLGRTLRMKVIAEGVETMLQQQLVEASGCELVQGHLHWRALDCDRASALVGSTWRTRARLAG